MERNVVGNTVNTVLGPVPIEQLGVVSVHESLLYVLPGAQYGHDIVIDHSVVFATLAAKLNDFKAAGGGTIVDASGMFAGRDLPLYEALAQATGVHIVASTGQAEEAMLGGYFLTPQTNPPKPWPAEKFATLYAKEVTEGMVVPRVERRAAAGLISTAATRSGMTPTDESQFRGCARAAALTGVALSFRPSSNALHDAGIVLEEGPEADRVVIGEADRRDLVETGLTAALAKTGVYLAIDHVGSDSSEFISDAERARLVVELVASGYGDRVVLSASATGAAFGVAANMLPYDIVLTKFVPTLRRAGLANADVERIIVANPAELLAVR